MQNTIKLTQHLYKKVGLVVLDCSSLVGVTYKPATKSI